MVDLERLDEALANPLNYRGSAFDVITEAARAYRDLRVNVANVAAGKPPYVACGEVLAVNRGRDHWSLACFRQADHNGPHTSAISWEPADG